MQQNASVAIKERVFQHSACYSPWWSDYTLGDGYSGYQAFPGVNRPFQPEVQMINPWIMHFNSWAGYNLTLLPFLSTHIMEPIVTG